MRAHNGENGHTIRCIHVNGMHISKTSNAANARQKSKQSIGEEARKNLTEIKSVKHIKKNTFRMKQIDTYIRTKSSTHTRQVSV